MVKILHARKNYLSRRINKFITPYKFLSLVSPVFELTNYFGGSLVFSRSPKAQPFLWYCSLYLKQSSKENVLWHSLGSLFGEGVKMVGELLSSILVTLENIKAGAGGRKQNNIPTFGIELLDFFKDLTHAVGFLGR